VLENTDWKAQILQARHGFFVLPECERVDSSWMRCAMPPQKVAPTWQIDTQRAA
jgi:hypothetical protein